MVCVWTVCRIKSYLTWICSRMCNIYAGFSLFSFICCLLQDIPLRPQRQGQKCNAASHHNLQYYRNHRSRCLYLGHEPSTSQNVQLAAEPQQQQFGYGFDHHWSNNNNMNEENAKVERRKNVSPLLTSFWFISFKFAIFRNQMNHVRPHRVFNHFWISSRNQIDHEMSQSMVNRQK